MGWTLKYYIKSAWIHCFFFSLQTPAKSGGLVYAEGDRHEDRTLELSADAKSVSRASQLLTSDSSLTFSRDNTIR